MVYFIGRHDLNINVSVVYSKWKGTAGRQKVDRKVTVTSFDTVSICCIMSLDEEKDNRNESKKCKLEILKQFCDNTSIHGLKYVVENGNLLYERFVNVFNYSK